MIPVVAEGARISKITPHIVSTVNHHHLLQQGNEAIGATTNDPRGISILQSGKIQVGARDDAGHSPHYHCDHVEDRKGVVRIIRCTPPSHSIETVDANYSLRQRNEGVGDATNFPLTMPLLQSGKQHGGFDTTDNDHSLWYRETKVKNAATAMIEMACHQNKKNGRIMGDTTINNVSPATGSKPSEMLISVSALEACYQYRGYEYTTTGEKSSPPLLHKKTALGGDKRKEGGEGDSDNDFIISTTLNPNTFPESPTTRKLQHVSNGNHFCTIDSSQVDARASNHAKSSRENNKKRDNAIIYNENLPSLQTMLSDIPQRSVSCKNGGFRNLSLSQKAIRAIIDSGTIPQSLTNICNIEILP